MGRQPGCISHNKGKQMARTQRAKFRVLALVKKGYDLATATKKAYWEFGINI